MREILKGVIDLHIHAGPSVADRSVEAAEMLRRAVEAGYRGFVVKDHYIPTMMSAILVEKHLNSAANPVHVYGGICLNNSVGGFNLLALDAALGMGAKFVWFPTVSSKNHIDGHKGKGKFAGSGDMTVEEDPMYYIDKDGKLIPEAKAVIEFLKGKPEVILSTGHATPAEIDALVTEARDAGLEKVIVNHPHFLVNASMELIEKWGKLGAYIELNAGVAKGLSSSDTVPLSVYEKIMEIVALDQIVLDSDFGQKSNGDPVEKFYNFILALMNDVGVTEDQINLMSKRTPAKLVGLE